MPLDRATTYKSELMPLPMRVTRLHIERLREARNRDGLSVQEHVRRALDIYLNKIEREFNQKEITLPERKANQPDPQGIAAALAAPSVSALRSSRIGRSQPVVRTK
jgi:hypothetical protein